MRRESRGSIVITVMTCALCAFTAPGVLAQQADSGALEEIVVTAQKRESSIETTPISITALTGADLGAKGIVDIGAIVQSVPGVSMHTSGPGQTELEMRGMTSAGGNSPTVGFYLDETPLTAPSAAQNGKVVINPSLYDLNRVEVLRGPQGTLYGSGSMGGTIRLIPNAPDPKGFDASAEVLLGHTSSSDSLNRTVNAMINVPISDAAALRVVGTSEYLGGWIDRIVIADGQFPLPTNAGTTRGNVAGAPIGTDYHDVNDERLNTVRASILWNPTDRLSIAPSFLYQVIRQDGLTLIDNPPGTNTQYQPFNSPEKFQDRIDLSSLTAKYHFDFADLTSTTSYWTRDEFLPQDGSEEFATLLGLPLYPAQGGIGQTKPAYEDETSKQFSQEVRLSSPNDSHLKWLLGYFYSDFKAGWFGFIQTPFNPSTSPFPSAVTLFDQLQTNKILQNSVFGELSYEVLPKLTATVGARRYRYNAPVYVAVSGYLSTTGGDQVQNFVTSESDQGVTPKASLSYQATPELLVYGTGSQGFRPGGGNQVVPTAGALNCIPYLPPGLTEPPLSFKPDKVWSYELGEKYRDHEGRWSVNSAGYFENWQNIQQIVPLGCGFPITLNGGAAHIYGAELEVNAVLLPGLIFAVNGSWTHARYTVNGVPSATMDERVQNVPDETFGASLSYRHRLFGDITFMSDVESNYVGSRIDSTFQANRLGAYDLTNVRAGLEGSHWSAIAFINNVTNRTAALSNATAVNVNVPTFNRVAVSRPLTVGVDFSYQWR